jgi:hypothetical protein
VALTAVEMTLVAKGGTRALDGPLVAWREISGSACLACDELNGLNK